MNKRHTMKVNSNTFRIEWPYYAMTKNDYFVIKGNKAKEVKTRAVAAAYHYREAYGKWFKAHKVNENEYHMVCVVDQRGVL